MIQKYLPPNRLLHAKQFAMMCDYSFMRTNQAPHTYIQPNNFEDVKSGCTVYCYGDQLNRLFFNLTKNGIYDITLISGDNDFPSNPNGSLIGWPASAHEKLMPCPPNIKRWFASNAEVTNNIMKPFPTGVAKWFEIGIYPENKNHSEMTIDRLKSVMIDVPRNKLALLSGGCHYSNPIIRSAVESIVRTCCPAATISQRMSHQEYYEELQKHLFVVCPPGNGKDTHRVWEALYFGAIPIVEDSEMYRYFSKLFPILIVESWFQITEDFLINKYKEYSNKNWRYDLLDAENYFFYHNIPIKNSISNSFGHDRNE